MSDFETFLDSEHQLSKQNLAEDDYAARFYIDRSFEFLNGAELMHAEAVDDTIAIADAGGATGIDERFAACRRTAMVLNRIRQAVIDGNEDVMRKIDSCLAYTEAAASSSEEKRLGIYGAVEIVYGTSGLVNLE